MCVFVNVFILLCSRVWVVITQNYVYFCKLYFSLVYHVLYIHDRFLILDSFFFLKWLLWLTAKESSEGPIAAL